MRFTSRIPLELRGVRRESNNRVFPGALSCTCPFCGQKGIFALDSNVPVNLQFTWATYGTCPSCSKRPEFILVFESKEGTGATEVSEILMVPAASNHIEPLSLPCDFPARLKQAISDAEESFRVGLYSPALTCGGRALEGIFLHLAKQKSGDSEKTKDNLFTLIEKVAGDNQASEPLRKLSHAIRQGRNIGAHFDETMEPDKESAFLVIELLHYLTNYFFDLPEKIRYLEEKLRNQDGE